MKIANTIALTGALILSQGAAASDSMGELPTNVPVEVVKVITTQRYKDERLSQRKKFVTTKPKVEKRKVTPEAVEFWSRLYTL